MTPINCYICKIGKESSEFYDSSLAKQDFQCKSCSKDRGQAWRKKKTETRDLKARFSTAKSSARSRKLIFSLTIQEFDDITKLPCHYCGKINDEMGIGLDRISNNKAIGYTPENVLSCCCVCNRIRGNNLTVKEMEVAMAAVTAYKLSVI